jgi:hypothetical protein
MLHRFVFTIRHTRDVHFCGLGRAENLPASKQQGRVKLLLTGEEKVSLYKPLLLVSGRTLHRH